MPPQPRTTLRPPTTTSLPGSGTATPTATSGSQTITQTNPSPSIPIIPALRLRAGEPPQSSHRRIQWAEDVVDNENMGKKSSKVCCIYHAPHEPGDSSSESDSSPSSDEDSEGEDLSRAQKAGGSKGKGRKGRRRGKVDGDEGPCEKGELKGRRKASPNAYERVPKAKAKREG